MSIRHKGGLAASVALAAVAMSWLGCAAPQSTGTDVNLPSFASLEAARAHALDQGVPVLVDFYTDW